MRTGHASRSRATSLLGIIEKIVRHRAVREHAVPGDVDGRVFSSNQQIEVVDGAGRTVVTMTVGRASGTESQTWSRPRSRSALWSTPGSSTPNEVAPSFLIAPFEESSNGAYPD